jgi:hypothetical protein
MASPLLLWLCIFWLLVTWFWTLVCGSSGELLSTGEWYLKQSSNCYQRHAIRFPPVICLMDWCKTFIQTRNCRWCQPSRTACIFSTLIHYSCVDSIKEGWRAFWRFREPVILLSCTQDTTISGYNGLSHKILIHCVNLISKCFTHVYNSSLNSRIYPDRCKCAIVQPSYKNRDKTNIIIDQYQYYCHCQRFWKR